MSSLEEKCVGQVRTQETHTVLFIKCKPTNHILYKLVPNLCYIWPLKSTNRLNWVNSDRRRALDKRRLLLILEGGEREEERFYPKGQHPFLCFSYIENHSWSRGSAITTPKTDTSNSIIHAGNPCFLFFLLSFKPPSESSFVVSTVFADSALLLLSWGDSGAVCCVCSASCCWLYFSTYSGNSFRNAGL